jgi:WD40 repeat protein
MDGATNRRSFAGDGRSGTIAFSADGSTLAEIDGEDVQFWDVAHREHRDNLFGADEYEVTSLAYSPDGRLLATAGTSRIRFWDPTTRRSLGKPLLANDTEFSRSSPSAPMGERLPQSFLRKD